MHEADPEDFFLRPKSNTPIQDMPQDNGPVHVECSIISNIMVSAMESELGGLFESFQRDTSTRTSLADTGHQKPPTLVATDNTESKSIVNGTAKQKRSCAIDMRFIGSEAESDITISTYSGKR